MTRRLQEKILDVSNVLDVLECQENLKLASSRAVGVSVAIFSLLFTVMVSKVAEPFHCKPWNDTYWTSRTSGDYDCFDFGDST